MNPLPRFPNNSDDRDTYYASSSATSMPTASDPVEQWLQQREQRAQAQLRSPLVLGAQRIALAKQRCRELEEELSETRTALLNLPARVESGRVSSLEERAIKLAAELHAERLAVWKDLQPLAQQITDASLDAMRQHWLDLLAQTDTGGDVR